MKETKDALLSVRRRIEDVKTISEQIYIEVPCVPFKPFLKVCTLCSTYGRFSTKLLVAVIVGTASNQERSVKHRSMLSS